MFKFAKVAKKQLLKSKNTGYGFNYILDIKRISEKYKENIFSNYLKFLFIIFLYYLCNTGLFSKIENVVDDMF